MSQICAKELTRYGVKSNCIAPAARTRLTLSTPGLGDMIQAPEEAGAFDVWDPANISPLVAYLATATARSTARPSSCRAARSASSSRGSSARASSRTSAGRWRASQGALGPLGPAE